MKWLVLLVGVLCSVGVKAVDVNSANALKDALQGKATVNGNTVTLTGNVNISETIKIKGGDIILNLAKYIISMEKTNSKATCILVDGNNARLLIKGGGKISVTTKYKFGGGSGYDAVALEFKSGFLQILDCDLEASTPSVATAYTIKSSTSLASLIPYGAYVSNQNISYTDSNLSEYMAWTKGTYATNIKSSNYKAVFNINGQQYSAISNYTLDGGFSYPNYEVGKGYEFSNWRTSTNNVTYVNDIPVLTNRVASGTITFDATTLLIEYKISYDLNGGDTNPNTIEYYTIKENEGKPITLQAPTRRGYDFTSWRHNDAIVRTINYDDVEAQSVDKVYTLTAQWEKHIYNVTFDVNVNGVKQGTFTIDDNHFSEPDADQIPEGKVFDGWYIKGTNTKVEFPLVELKDLQLEAHWKDKTYYASFYDGNTEVNKEPFTVTTGLASFENPDFKDGYIFEYWMDVPEMGKRLYLFLRTFLEIRSFMLNGLLSNIH